MRNLQHITCSTAQLRRHCSAGQNIEGGGSRVRAGKTKSQMEKANKRERVTKGQRRETVESKEKQLKKPTCF